MSQSDWKKGDFALRKGKLCEVTHIDFALHPPAVTVKMMHTGDEAGTEFSKLTKVAAPKWTCGVCTFDNEMNEKSCIVCAQGKLTDAVYKRALERIENTIQNQKGLKQNGNQPTHWKCSLCTFDNPMFNDECQMCLTIRTHDAKLIYPNNPNFKNNKNDNDNDRNRNGNKNNNKNDNSNEKKNENENHEIDNVNDGQNINNDEKENDNKDNFDKDKENEKGKEKSDSDENLSNESEWTLIDKAELNDEDNDDANEKSNDSENKEKSKNGDDPYLELE